MQCSCALQRLPLRLPLRLPRRWPAPAAPGASRLLSAAAAAKPQPQRGQLVLGRPAMGTELGARRREEAARRRTAQAQDITQEELEAIATELGWTAQQVVEHPDILLKEAVRRREEETREEGDALFHAHARRLAAECAPRAAAPSAFCLPLIAKCRQIRCGGQAVGAEGRLRRLEDLPRRAWGPEAAAKRGRGARAEG